MVTAGEVVRFGMPEPALRRWPGLVAVKRGRHAVRDMSVRDMSVRNKSVRNKSVHNKSVHNKSTVPPTLHFRTGLAAGRCKL